MSGQYFFSNNAIDASENQYDGTILGATGTSDRFGNEMSALEFDGINDHILIPNDFDYPERTVNIWFSSGDIHPNNGMIFNIDHLGLTNGNVMMRLFQLNGEKVIRMNGGGGGTATSVEIPINENQWYMATIVMNSETILYYLDCELVGTSPNLQNSSNNGTSNTVVGTDRDFSPFYTGKIDDLTIYDCFLDSSKICELFNAPNPLSCLGDINEDGLVDVFDFMQLNSSYGATCDDCPEDLNGDGVVDVNDFMILCSNYGNSCN